MASSTKLEKPKIEVDRSPTRCPYCHEDVKPAEDSWVVCMDCLARHHRDCWQDGSRCSSCGQTGFLEPASTSLYRAPGSNTKKLARPGDWPTLAVDKSGGGDFATITEAIRSASPGMRISVAPGTYCESIVLDKPLAIVGRGDAGDILVESNGVECVVMQTDQAMVRGVTLRARAGLGHAAKAVVSVLRGVLRLWDCDVGSGDSFWPCLSVAGGGNPNVRRCNLHGGQGGGVLIAEHGSGTFEDCEIHGFRQYGVGIKTGANPIFDRCQIHGTAIGLFIDESGRGSYRDCEIWNASDAGVRLTHGATPIFSKCKIHDCGDGVTVNDTAEGTFEECTIAGSKRSNVLVERMGHPIFKRCKLDKSQGSGVTVSAAGLGIFDDCTINENAQTGVTILLGADPAFERCKIRRNGRAGIWVRQDGRGKVEGCDLTQNDSGAWQIEGRCQVFRKNNKD